MENTRTPKRKHMLLILAAAFTAAGLAYFAYWFLYGQFHESTDDAYVAGNLVQVMPQHTGNVVSLYADDTDLVAMGQPVVVLDHQDEKIALQKAEARLGQAIRNVRHLFEVARQARADLNENSTRLAQAKTDLARRQNLIKEHAVSREELEHAADAVTEAQSQLEGSRHRLDAASAAVENTTVRTNPAVLDAEAEVRKAWLDLKRTVILAPATGYVAKRAVQIGQRVTPSTTLMNIVPLNEIWVDANFKEDQLQHIRIGQPVILTSDLYGNGVKFHGRVEGVGAGTGSVFALLPAQNATGNWIKVVQRLPVRVSLQRKEVWEHPLRVGLSMDATVDTHNQQGDVLSKTLNAKPIYSTSVFGKGDRDVEKLIQSIFDKNQ